MPQPGTDNAQALRMRRHLLAGAVSILYLLVLAVLYLQGSVRQEVLLEAAGLVLGLVAAFYLVFRSGFNLRFADPSLTAAQMMSAVLTMLYVAYREPITGEAFTAFVFLAFLFGMLKLETRRLSLLALLTLGLYAGITLPDILRGFATARGSRELTQLFVLMLTLPWFIYIGDYVRRLRRTLKERELAERDLRLSEERHRELMDALPVAVCRIDERGRAVYRNAWWQELLGAGSDDWLDAGHPQDLEEVRSSWERSAGEGSWRHEYRIQGPDGGVRWVDMRAHPMGDTPAAGYVCIAVDITQRRKAEEARRESELRLQLAQEVSDAGIQDWRMDTGEMLWDERTRRYLGVSAEATPTLELFMQAVHPEDRPEVKQMLARAHDPAGDGSYCVECRVQGLDTGTERWIEAKGRVFFEGRRPVRLIGTIQDISERKAGELALKEADRRKDQFLATLAHELRNPLAPLRNAAQIMAMLPGTPELERVRQMISRQVNQLARLVDDLLDVSRITMGKVRLRAERVDLRDVFRMAFEMARPALQAKDHSFSLEQHPEPVWVKGDSLRLAQVIGNLLDNAAKYTDEGGRIVLSLEATPTEAVVRVRDNGTGIARELLPRVFDLFMQADGSHLSGGLGIGLSLVRSLVAMHGGRVEAHSEGPGQGSEFVVRLPRLAAEAARPAEPHAETGSFAGRPLKVLVVDDNVDAAESLATLLLLHGHDVVTVHGASAALGAARQLRPDVAMLDIGLPGMDGYELARRLREQPELDRTLLVALTGFGQPDDRRRALAAGFSQHFVKPVDPSVLLDLLTKL